MTVKIFVADDVSDSGLQPLRDAGVMVEKRIKLRPDQLLTAVGDCEGGGAQRNQSDSEVMDAARNLHVIGRAGVGVDNIDVPAATARGIVVMNAPDGNTITTAEHTIALLVALARNVPQANTSVKAAKWERKRFIGAELQGKTLGIVGLGRIGRAVATRARAFGMKIVAHDPFIAAEQAAGDRIRLH
jgi:D-3-phosphoglycerate dehydrogenase